MAGRVSLALITLFWVTMNVLLWRSEYGARQNTPVALETVWERLLTAADSSSLQIYRQRDLLGVVRWTPSVTAVEEGAVVEAPEGLEGMVRKAESYHIEIDGSFQTGDVAQRLRVTGSLDLDGRQRWREFVAAIHQRRNTWQLGGKAREKQLKFTWVQDGARTEQAMDLADLSNPQAWLGDLGALIPSGVLAAPFLQSGATNGLANHLKWSATQETLRAGSVRLRVYAIRARLLNQFEAVIYVNRAGEILRIDLPDRIRIVNAAFPHLLAP